MRLAQRAALHAQIRAFFVARGLLEVQTPVLSQAGNSDPNIESFSTDYGGPSGSGARARWLRTSPEFFMKRLLAGGSGDIYELGPVFRNGEYGPRHNPEFTLLEWYRVGFDHHQLMDEVAALVGALALTHGRELAKTERLSYAELYQRYLGIDPHADRIERLREPLAAFAINPDGLLRDDWLDLLRTHCIEPQLAADQALFVYDFPASQAALARVRAGSPALAERFELYLGPRELANGYHELGDAMEQRQRFERDLALRRARGAQLPALDEHLLSALPQMPACAGVALGVDRLHQWLVGASQITEVLNFPFDQA